MKQYLVVDLYYHVFVTPHHQVPSSPHPQVGNFNKSTDWVQGSVINVTPHPKVLSSWLPGFAPTIFTSIKIIAVETKAILYNLHLLIMYFLPFRYVLPMISTRKFRYVFPD